MTERTLTITTNPDWQGALRALGRRVDATKTYQGEFLNFHTAGDFFGRLTENRWELVRALQGQGEMSVRELARRAERDVRRVHDDVMALAELGLIERTKSDGVVCPFADIRIDMHLRAAA